MATSNERTAQRSRSAQRQQTIRYILDRYKRLQGCADCGTTEGVLHFDHIEPSTKLFTISKGVAHRSLGAILAEVQKCDVRCPACANSRRISRRYGQAVI